MSRTTRQGTIGNADTLMIAGGSTMTYGVTIQTLDRAEGNGITMVLVDATDEAAAEMQARRIAEDRYHCTVLVDHAVPWSKTAA
jgi:NAD-dependent SIR2 family protein deacetylase